MAKLRTRKHRVVLNRSVGGDTGITIILSLMGIFMFLPMWYLIVTAFKPLGERNITPPRFYVMKPTLQNFIDLFTNMNMTWVPISRYIFNTIIISILATLGCLILGSLTAYALSKIRFPGSNFIFALIRYSLMISATVAGITNFIIFVALGWLNTYQISIIPVWASTLGLYLMKQFIDGNVSDEMIEAARIDGASEVRIYWDIVMPLVKPAWLTLMVTTFQGVWNTGASGYVWSENLKTFNSAITTISGVSTGASSAAIVLMMSVPITVFIINQSKIVETMASSGMKD
ncbi:MAG: carbohydrate ABC transporter permease [Eubacteriales bacterium]|jgi:ABC-type glycerol-3-phosphate transport system permease component|nr:carbohydrate ABC transporter permease [Clostridiales bacterium]